jgi:glycosyltransferase involved in cell wall biosynthesis
LIVTFCEAVSDGAGCYQIRAASNFKIQSGSRASRDKPTNAMSRPRVSIGMPVYNGANYLLRSVQSLLAQDYEDFELIISDNGSSDETEPICHELAGGDCRIRYFRNEINRGAAWNYNNVFRLARGEFFKWAAHDDECHPTMFRGCVEVLERAPDRVTMVYALAELIDEQGKTLRPTLDRIEFRDPRPHRRLAHLLWSLRFCDPVFGMFKTKYLKKTRLIGNFFGADIVLLGELAMLGEIWELNAVLFRLRWHLGRSMTANRSSRARAAWFDPGAARQLFVMPDWERMVWELYKSVQRSSLPPAEKLRCCLRIPGTYRYWRRFWPFGERMTKRVKAFLSIAEKVKHGYARARILRRVR